MFNLCNLAICNFKISNYKTLTIWNGDFLIILLNLNWRTPAKLHVLHNHVSSFHSPKKKTLSLTSWVTIFYKWKGITVIKKRKTCTLLSIYLSPLKWCGLLTKLYNKKKNMYIDNISIICETKI
jgi:hypothetical protein